MKNFNKKVESNISQKQNYGLKMTSSSKVYKSALHPNNKKLKISEQNEHERPKLFHEQHDSMTLKSTSSHKVQNLNILKANDLMCWVSDYRKLRLNEKYEIAYKNMIKKYSLIGLFKCMGKKCSYTTDDLMEIINHFSMHNREMAKRKKILYEKYKNDLTNAINDDEVISKLKLEHFEQLKSFSDFILCCSYCQFKGKDYKLLVHHINDVHRKDIFQCAYCFFRSCVKQTCREHLEISHKDKEILIYECPGKNIYELAKEKAKDRLCSKRQLNVTVLRCKICNIGFYPLKEFLEHCEKNHRSEKEIKEIEQHLHILDETFKLRAYGMFQCLYCVHGSQKKSQILSHLIEHPSEFGFYCVRECPQTNDDPYFYTLIESTKIVEVTSDFDVLEFNEKPELLCLENYKNIVDNDLKKAMKFMSLQQ